MCSIHSINKCYSNVLNTHPIYSFLYSNEYFLVLGKIVRFNCTHCHNKFKSTNKNNVFFKLIYYKYILLLYISLIARAINREILVSYLQT